MYIYEDIIWFIENTALIFFYETCVYLLPQQKKYESIVVIRRSCSIKGVFLSVNPETDFRSKNGFRVPFGKSKSGFLIWWILFEKGFIGFEIRRIQIQINGLVIYTVPFTVDPKLVRWSSGISSWSIFIEAVEFPRCCHLPQNIWTH